MSPINTKIIIKLETSVCFVELMLSQFLVNFYNRDIPLNKRV